MDLIMMIFPRRGPIMKGMFSYLKHRMTNFSRREIWEWRKKRIRSSVSYLKWLRIFESPFEELHWERVFSLSWIESLSRLLCLSSINGFERFSLRTHWFHHCENEFLCEEISWRIFFCGLRFFFALIKGSSNISCWFDEKRKIF